MLHLKNIYFCWYYIKFVCKGVFTFFQIVRCFKYWKAFLKILIIFVVIFRRFNICHWGVHFYFANDLCRRYKLCYCLVSHINSSWAVRNFFTTDGKFYFIGAASVSYSINLLLKPLFSCNGIHFICVSRNSTYELQLSTWNLPN